MVRIGLLSDTHSYLGDNVFEHFAEVDEIWHAGDIGDLKVANCLEDFGKPTRIVYGNIDGSEARLRYKEDLHFEIEGLKVWMTHIGGYPGRYNKRVQKILDEGPTPGLFICGHSHILKVIYDKKYQMLAMNPGACGKFGRHQVITMLRFSIEGGKLKDLEVIESPR